MDNRMCSQLASLLVSLVLTSKSQRELPQYQQHCKIPEIMQSRNNALCYRSQRHGLGELRWSQWVNPSGCWSVGIHKCLMQAVGRFNAFRVIPANLVMHLSSPMVSPSLFSVSVKQLFFKFWDKRKLRCCSAFCRWFALGGRWEHHLHTAWT